MDDKLKNAFHAVRAEDDLLCATRRYVTARRRPALRYLRPVLAAACLGLCLLAGGWTYMTPTAEVSIGSAGLQLGVNCFDRVVSVTGESAGLPTLKHARCDAAVEQILAQERLAEKEIAITVDGESDAQSSRLVETITLSSGHHGNVHCYAHGQAPVSSPPQSGSGTAATAAPSTPRPQGSQGQTQGQDQGQGQSQGQNSGQGQGKGYGQSGGQGNGHHGSGHGNGHHG